MEFVPCHNEIVGSESRDISNQLKEWRSFFAFTGAVCAALGLAVEHVMDKSHSYTWAAVGFAVLGVLGALSLINFDKSFSWMGHAVSGWIAGPSLFVAFAWLWDFHHGFVLTHHYANFAAFVVGGAFGYLKIRGAAQEAEVAIQRQTVKTFGHETAVNISVRPKTTTRDLPGLIRELALALNNNFDMTERQKRFVEENLLAALNGLIQVGRADKAAQLCRKVPANWIKFEVCLRGLDLEDGLKLASASFKIDDWGTALRLLDWALRSFPGPKLEHRVFHTAELLADQVRILDEAFDAKVTALQLSPKLRQALLPKFNSAARA